MFAYNVNSTKWKQDMKKQTTKTLNDLLDIHEAAAYLHMNVRTLRYYRMRRIGPDPVFISPRVMRFKKEVLDDWRRKVLDG